MQTLSKTIYEAYKASSLDGLFTGIFHTKVPKGTEFPYLVFSLVTDKKEETYTEEYQNIMLRMTVHTNDSDVYPGEVLMDAVLDEFDNAELDVDGRAFVGISRVNTNQLAVKDGWEVSTLFECNLQREGQAELPYGSLWNLIGF